MKPFQRYFFLQISLGEHIRQSFNEALLKSSHDQSKIFHAFVFILNLLFECFFVFLGHDFIFLLEAQIDDILPSFSISLIQIKVAPICKTIQEGALLRILSMNSLLEIFDPVRFNHIFE